MGLIRNNPEGIPDPIAYRAVKRRLYPGPLGWGRGGLDPDRASRVKKLEFRDGENLRSLDFLRFFPNLEQLALDAVNLTDLLGLYHTPKLTHLCLASDWPGPFDLSPVSSCRALVELEVGLSRELLDHPPGVITVNGAETLLRLPALESLSLCGLGLRDLGWITHMKSIRKANLSYNFWQDLSPLKALPALRELDLSQCDLRSVGALADMPGLHRVTLRGNLIEDFRPLLDLPDLRELYAAENGLSPQDAALWRERFPGARAEF